MPKYLIKRLIEKRGDDMKNETGKGMVTYG